MKKTIEYILNHSRFAEYAEFYWILYFLILWIHPQFILELDPEAGQFLGQHMTLEFMFGHATVGLLVPMIFVKSKKRLLSILIPFSFIYGLFFIVFIITSGAWIPVIIFTVYILKKLSVVMKGFIHKVKSELIFEVTNALIRIFFFLFCAIPAILPWPTLGVANVNLNIEGTGLFVENPEKFVVYLLLYYISIAIYENNFQVRVSKMIKRLVGRGRN